MSPYISLQNWLSIQEAIKSPEAIKRGFIMKYPKFDPGANPRKRKRKKKYLSSLILKFVLISSPRQQSGYHTAIGSSPI